MRFLRNIALRPRCIGRLNDEPTGIPEGPLATTFKMRTHVPLLIRFFVFFVASVIITPWVAESASAQVVAAYYNGDGDFGYDIQSMSDIDQRRATLPNDGNFYCVPTATMNLFAYAANFGYPDLPPGPGFWEGAPGHGTMTSNVGFLGLFMNTNPTGGTSFSNMVDGAEAWIADADQQLFTSANARQAGFWPTIDDLTEIAVNGGLVQFCYGRYDWQLVADRPFLTGRTSGHCVTLELAHATNGQIDGPRLIHMRNPGTDDGNLNVNSDFSSSDLDDAENILIATNILDDKTVEYNVTSLLNPTPGQYRIIDSYLALFPNGGAGYSGVQMNPMFVGGGLGFVQNQTPSPFSPPPGGTILSVIPGVLPHSTLVLVGMQDTTQLFHVRHSGRFDHLGDLPADTIGLASGPGNTFYACGPIYITSYSFNGNTAGPSVIPGENIQLPTGTGLLKAVVFDRESQELIMATGSGKFEPIIFRKRIDAATPLIASAVAGVGDDTCPFRHIAVDNGSVFAALSNGTVAKTPLHSTDEDFNQMVFQTVKLPLATDVIAVEFDSLGRLYVSDQQQGLLEYVSDGNGGWVFPKTFNFVSLVPPGNIFVPFRNRTNIRPGDLRESEWKNIDPSQLAPLGTDVPD